MKIIYRGESSFVFSNKKNIIAFNPFAPTDANIVLLGQSGLDKGFSNTKVFSWPGEYEVSGVPIIAIKIPFSDNVIYKFALDEINVAVLDGLTDILPDDILEKIGDVDVLLIHIESMEAANKIHDVVEDIDPRVIIPFGYNEVDLAKSAKEFGCQAEELDSIELMRSTLPVEKERLIVLKKALS
ncbi:MAG: hypothetical protein UR28_C0036G0002 [Candidatus Peregrinibacteria bacterium GW2011_GWF2_33_10]|nr:MAG: hypothetical protein UR28_C0036G0002 [Candidatus Peregrinibacteria bacterium GW2011_GWF2_33_10]OGJ43942.1 MAG: hypothetical protein A2272_04935 [Candidatus Peregrinibacteria bacterium RIFOXYA12_FULL_33_12]OGJ46023.1 MAG: hypothetical protein A2263_03330 [Candidatus Peregrinibacteria bacterium RIFOXYA2_FULL_33_21]OGJ51728.1 MAG: hypothetical protein A2307_04360 [Candidatus Peregrinibacteria bacterium RIFOXYB2_FULL_33_20]